MKSKLSLLRLMKALAYSLFVIGLTAGCVLFLTSANVRGVFEALANHSITFVAAGVGVIAVEAVVCWRYNIDPVGAFNVIEKDSKACAQFLGLLSLGLCIMGGAIFGAL